ncbi:MAG: DNA-binding protein [Actinomycetota bacterium]|nr:DNA-binding protein [Actinomycetota bacterium]
MNAPELMGTAEVAALLGVSRQRVLKLAERPDFPSPLAVLSMGKVWDGARVREWAADYTPRTRRT